MRTIHYSYLQQHLAVVALRVVVATLMLVCMPHMSQASAKPQSDPKLDSLLHCIDSAIDHSDEYVARKTERIADLREKLGNASSPAAKYTIAFELYREYLPFVNDSAIHYLDICSDLAMQTGDRSKAGGCRSLVALSCSNAGLYLEAKSILATVTPDALHGEDLGLYYYALAHVSGEVAYYSRFDDMRSQYGKEADRYRNLMLGCLPADNKYSRQCREMMVYGKRQYAESLRMNTDWLSKVKKGSADYALVTFFRYLEYKAVGDSVQMMRWLAESVLSDIQNAVMDQGSMWEMANLLMVAGDVDRSYRYICYTSDCANRFGSRQRLSRISPLLSRIAQSYKAEEEASNRSLRKTLIVISVMAVVLLAMLVLILRHRNRLAEARDKLAVSNSQLRESNSQQQQLTDQQRRLNAQLASLNAQLSEANRVKEEYVGRFMRLCSLYIDKLDTLRKKVAKRVKSHQYAELAELTRSADFKAETEELYANFDTAFLHLFPTFVDEFNAMLAPDNRIQLPEDGRLNTVIRIFALIRLGITDSSKIAEFLHYSVNTIYNYRANVKNGALVDRAEFEHMVKLIGTPMESETSMRG